MSLPADDTLRRIVIVFGAAFGDEGKGLTVAEIAKLIKATLTVRFNGGATAGHSVWRKRKNGRIEKHVYQQFGSSTFEHASTYLSKFFRFKPYDFIGELTELKELGFNDKVTQRVMLDQRAVVTTPYHTAHSQMMGPIHNRGTCGVGSGESWRYSLVHPESTIYGADLLDEALMRSKLRMQAEYYKEASPLGYITQKANAVEEIADFMAWVGSMIKIVGEDDWLRMRDEHKAIVMEGSQGYWISVNSPFAPYVTSSDTSPRQAREMINGYTGNVSTVACVNMYTSRHGPGPLPTEDPKLFEIFKAYAHEGQWNGVSRYGWFDSYLTAKCLQEVGCIDYMAVSHLDHFNDLDRWRMALNYRNKKGDPVYRSFKRLDSYLKCMAEQVGHEINIVGRNPYEREFINFK